MQNNQLFQPQQPQQQQLSGGPPPSAQPPQNTSLQRSPLLLPQTEDIAVINKLLETLSNSLDEQWSTVDSVLGLVDQLQVAEPGSIPEITFSSNDSVKNGSNNDSDSPELIESFNLNKNLVNSTRDDHYDEDNGNSGLDTPTLNETSRIEHLQLANQNLRVQIQMTQIYTSIQAQLIQTYLHGIEKILGWLRTFVAHKLGQTLDLHHKHTAQIERLQDDSAQIIFRNAQLEGGIFKMTEMLRSSLRRICEKSDNDNSNTGANSYNISNGPTPNGPVGQYHSETKQRRSIGLAQFEGNIMLQAEFLNAEINTIKIGLADLKRN
ncbi:hypothetical protein NADFUDRAFT_82061 [Nadsonia fulvescens var. elongata DSM 6958]|uniref:Uncharacterized protein n=1 Tax=Nadsonia fulvescens var. elongata DSM 6958 TaxID=857566 RepID=A0A1E3PQE6_9ASCO|nr:hypothetical protein NADFUDRAFT_82061 [Nadsonia fulvescens var. elongata DSM 6958]